MKFKSEGPNSGYGRFNVKPVTVGKRYEVEIEEISDQGGGIARIHGFVIFVKGGKKGQKVKVRITKVGSSFAIGEAVHDQTIG